MKNRICSFRKRTFIERDLAKKQQKIIITKNNSPNGITYSGITFEMEYEELVDLLAHYRKTGEEASLTKKRAEDAMKILPETSY